MQKWLAYHIVTHRDNPALFLPLFLPLPPFHHSDHCISWIFYIRDIVNCAQQRSTMRRAAQHRSLYREPILAWDCVTGNACCTYDFFLFFFCFFFSFADKTLADPWITCGSRCKGPPSIIPFAACTLWLCLWNNYTVQSDTQSTHPVWLSPEITLTFLAEFCYDVHADSISDRKLSPH